MKKKSTLKKIYQVFMGTQYGIGMQPVKANSKSQAKERFLKRFPKKKVVSIEYSEGYQPIITPI